MPIIIKGRFGIRYRQSPYLFNSFWKVEISQGNKFENVVAKSKYVKLINGKIPEGIN